MKFVYKDKEYTLPNTLEEITLSQRIGFYKQYGAALDEQVKQISEMPEGIERELEEQQYLMRIAVETVSFYSGIDINEVKQNIEITTIIDIYNANISVLRQQEAEIEVQEYYEFNGEKWRLGPPELMPDSKMNFNQFLSSKEIVRLMAKMGSGNWEPLPYLCAIYLRKVIDDEVEPFEDSFIEQNSERLQLMNDLPLNIALAVGFFLGSTMTICRSLSQYSNLEEGVQVQTSGSTSTDGDGSHS